MAQKIIARVLLQSYKQMYSIEYRQARTHTHLALD